MEVTLQPGMWPVFRDKVYGVIYRLEDDGLIAGIFSGYRSPEEQDELYALGRTVKNPDGVDAEHPMGNIVTRAKGGRSWHNYGIAADLVFKVNGKWSWSDKLPWGIMGQHAHAVGLEWGGDWKEPKTDRPHLQLTCGMTIEEAAKFGDNMKVWEAVQKRMSSY